ncbi:HNH endonuclease signature motif containing protein [Actinacidiphila sp. DG2A-62]|uniref:HNH endonuclease signature motif containing protein n=1 Tax=Actinacidiphila sp. DG2A-62 TaxID=3108821 RepID=UPI002DB8642C|nr:HNH endonuclease signature motif containing protein [Actinacidiphila sp. DG2A-62]MEC3994390.1 HNH endonuclease signature motif containing protein [Actinacidiphila sp. DG2A-62]
MAGAGSARRRYSDDELAAAVAASTCLREVAVALGAEPASGTLSHLSRRIDAARIDRSHFPARRRQPPLPSFGEAELASAAARATSIRGVARALGVPDDGRARAALGRMLRAHGTDTSHFGGVRRDVPDARLRQAVAASTGYAAVARALGLEAGYATHRWLRRQVSRLGLDTAHFVRRPWAAARPPRSRASAEGVLVVLPAGSARTNRARLHRALQEIGVPHRCAECGNSGQWRGRPITLQIDHANGDWRDNRAANLRYLCPNCHAVTETWGRGGRRAAREADGP